MASKAPVIAFALGITSLAIGWIPVLGWILCIVAIIYGIVGLAGLREQKTKETGKLRSYAWIGIICASIPLLTWLFLGIFFISIVSLAFSLLPTAIPLIPDMCEIDNNFLCTGAMMTQDGLSISVLNNMDEQVASVIVTVGGAQCEPRNLQWAAGEEITFTCAGSAAQHRVISIAYTLADESRYHTSEGFLRIQ